MEKKKDAINMSIKEIEKSSKIGITKIYDLAKPTEAVALAVVLKNLIIQQKLYTNIKGKNYAHVDAWQMAGFLTGMNVIVEEPRNLSNDKEIKYSVTAKLFSGEKVIGKGYAICSSKEANKKTFDEYAVLSFAQTRAIGKAYRNKIGWILKLTGMQSTPSEEMHKVDEALPQPPETAINEDVGIAEISKKEDGVCFGIKGHCMGNGKVTIAEANYSMKIYKKPLCRFCQKAAKTPWR